MISFLGGLVFFVSVVIGAWDWGRSDGQETTTFRWALGGALLGMALYKLG